MQNMARKLRIEYPGAIYHVMKRGDRREPIFADDHDRTCFMETLGEACRKTDWQVHAYCLMPNHFHLVLETPQANLVDGMQWFLGTYTIRFNRRHKEFGHLFSGRYKSLVIDGSGDGYFKAACDYAHLNPARAGLLQPEEGLHEFLWSSFALYVNPNARPPWLRVDRLFGEWRIAQDSESGRRVFAEGKERRRLEDMEQEFAAIERGWCLGDDEFRRELLEQNSESPSTIHYGETVQEAVEVRAERALREALAQMGWTERDVQGRPKGHPNKVRLARELRARTTMPLAWIAQRLSMGSRGYLTWLLQEQQEENDQTERLI